MFDLRKIVANVLSIAYFFPSVLFSCSNMFVKNFNVSLDGQSRGHKCQSELCVSLCVTLDHSVLCVCVCVRVCVCVCL